MKIILIRYTLGKCSFSSTVHEFLSNVNRQANVTKLFPFLEPSWTNTILALYCESIIHRRKEIEQSNYGNSCLASWMVVQT